MDMVKDDVDDEQRDDIPSSTSSHTSKPWQVEGNVSLPSNDLDSLDYASRKSGDSESYAFLFRTLPLSASIVYTVFMVLACFLNKFLGMVAPVPNRPALHSCEGKLRFGHSRSGL